jgi:inhibitor of cysteine peptidase
MAMKSHRSVILGVVLATGLLAGPVALAAEGVTLPGGATAVSVSCDAFASEPSVAESVSVAVGTPVVLSLCSNPTTGYRWSEPVSSDPAVASVGGWTYSEPESDLLGAAGVEHVTIATHATGTAVISASYDQPWEGGEQGAWTVQLSVDVIDASALVIGCEEFEASPAVTRSVDLAVGASLVVSLCSNPSTGYRWSAPTSSDPAVASVSAWAYAPAQSADGMVGAPGTEQATVTANAPGSAVINASYDQPWEGGEQGAWTVELSIVVS